MLLVVLFVVTLTVGSYAAYSFAALVNCSASPCYGTPQADTINGSNGGEVIYAGSGRDTVNSGSGGDYSYGNEDADLVYGGPGNDQVFGNAGNDRPTLDGGLYGNDGVDLIEGGDGNDTLFGNDDPDRLYGEAHDDVLNSEDGNQDFANGGADHDVCRVDGLDIWVNCEEVY